MTGIVILVIAIIAATVITAAVTQDVTASFIVFVISCIVAIFLSGALFYFTGFYPNYSNGERIGFVVKCSQKGILFRTNEIDMQMGSGNQASLSPHFECSVPDQQLFEKINTNLGKEVKITYRQWITMPVWAGETNYEVTKVELVEKTY